MMATTISSSIKVKPAFPALRRLFDRWNSRRVWKVLLRAMEGAMDWVKFLSLNTKARLEVCQPVPAMQQARMIHGCSSGEDGGTRGPIGRTVGPARVVLLPRRPPVRPTSLERRLRGATALAVLGGYSLLVVFTTGYYRLSLKQDHDLIRSHLVVLLERRAPSRLALRSVVQQLLVPGIQLAIVPERPTVSVHRRRIGARIVNESSSPLQLADGTRLTLLLRQDVTDAIDQQGLTLKILALAAGISALLTALLMRRLLHRGLAKPLQSLSDQLAAYSSLAAPPPPLDVEAQPLELRPIAVSFNAMQTRLSLIWERQRAFMDTVAHELRTPITLISGHTQSLLRQQGQVPTAATLALINKEARRMSALVSDMLDMARKDAGRLELRQEPIDVEDLLLEVYERLAPTSAGRLRLEPPDIDLSPPLASGDRERLAQCLVAVTDNALRYSPATSPVQFRAESLSGAGASASRGRRPPLPPDHPGWLVIHVMDRGPGVPQEERQRIFERFVRGSTALNIRGSGIGLAVVQLLMEAMHGRVVVADTPGGGADFQLWLPLSGTPQPAPAPP